MTGSRENDIVRLMKTITVSVTLSDEDIKKIVRPYERRIKELERDNAKLLKNAMAVANAKIKTDLDACKNRLSLVYGEFDSRKEKKDWEKFYREHEKCRSALKINAGRIPYVVEVGTGIGTCRKVVCPICGAEKDITDISVW